MSLGVQVAIPATLSVTDRDIFHRLNFVFLFDYNRSSLSFFSIRSVLRIVNDVAEFNHCVIHLVAHQQLNVSKNTHILSSVSKHSIFAAKFSRTREMKVSSVEGIAKIAW